MDKDERHALGAHFTSEADIQRIVLPTIIKPWQEAIGQANEAQELHDLREAIHNYRVLDPACGSGNFLYIAYRELVRLELQIIDKLYKNHRKSLSAGWWGRSLNVHQFHGIDKSAFAVELAKVTLTIAKELALQEISEWFQKSLALRFGESALPLDTLDDNIRCDDALFCEWPAVSAIIGNPPYQSKNKMQQEFGPEYVRRLRARYPEVPGRADYCVYWFRRAHDEILEGGRCGLVGTNTIRQNYSRQGGLDYIVKNGGTIVDAVASQVWSGESAVHVSIVNWVKGHVAGKKTLATQLGDHRDNPWQIRELEVINSSLSESWDVSTALALQAAQAAAVCYQGQTHGHRAFLLSAEQALNYIRERPSTASVIFPFLIGRDLVANVGSRPSRYVVDFGKADILQARSFPGLFERIEQQVLPDRQKAAEREAARNGVILHKNPSAQVNWHHRNFLGKWWQLSYPRQELMSKMDSISRYIACPEVTKRPIFEFIHPLIHPNAQIIVFLLEDDYSFGILQSNMHWEWFTARCSTLKGDWRYTSRTVFDSFPWPQSPSVADVRRIAKAAAQLRAIRRELMNQWQWSLRQLYRSMEAPGDHPLKKAHEILDRAVQRGYGIKSHEDKLSFLLALNQCVDGSEKAGEPVVGPGLPPCVSDASEFITTDCVMPPLSN
ncbi:MAG: DNA methyltransferase [Thermodesulfobacteriota bacterium]